MLMSRPGANLQAFAISQASPGPNMLIVSVIGWKVYGFLGALVATLAVGGSPRAAAGGDRRHHFGL